jgi:hypothetical protein
MRVHLVALAAATLGVQAWTVMTSAIDRPLTTPPPRRRKRHRAPKALPIELEAPIEDELAAKAQWPHKALRNRQRRQRTAPAPPPSTVQNVTDEWLGQAAQRARNHRPQRAPSPRRPFVFYHLRNSGGGELREALAQYAANRSVPAFVACHGDVPCGASEPPRFVGADSAAARFAVLAGHLSFAGVQRWAYASSRKHGPRVPQPRPGAVARGGPLGGVSAGAAGARHSSSRTAAYPNPNSRLEQPPRTAA